MSPANVEICSNCGRVLLRSEQAYLVGGKIVCAECDKVLRSKQVPQAASSPPKPFPETKKGTEKDASLRNRRILAAIGIVIVAVVLWKVCFSGPNIAVTEKIRRHKEPLSNEQVLLEVTVTTLTTKKPEDLIVVLNGPWGTDWGTRTHTIDNSCFLRDGSWTGRFLLSDSEFKAGQYRTIYPPSGSYTLMVKREKDWKVILKKNVNITSDMIKHAAVKEGW